MSVRRERDTRDVLTQKKKKSHVEDTEGRQPSTHQGDKASGESKPADALFGLTASRTLRKLIPVVSDTRPAILRYGSLGNTKHHLLRENTRAAAERQKGGTDCVAKVGHASKRGVSEKLIYKSG